MYRIYISENRNQTIFRRSRIFASHPGAKFIAVIDNSRDFNKDGWENFEFPLYAEGFSKIEFTEDNSDTLKMLKEAERRGGFSHNDKWHGHETLSEHNFRVEEALKVNKTITKDMIQLHDFGKPSTAKPNPKDENYLCYNNHGSVGTRELISYMSTKDIKDYYLHLVICSYHMAFVTEDYTQKRKPEIFEMLKRENLFEMLKEFSEADQLPPKNN